MTFVACAPPEAEEPATADAPATGAEPGSRPGSPFLDSTSKVVSGGEGFLPYAFGLGATFGVEDGAFGTWTSAEGSDEAGSVSLSLFTWSYLESGDPAGLCTVTYPVDSADPLLLTYDYTTFTAGTTGPWTARGFTVTLDGAAASTDCPALEATWGDAAALLDGATLGLGVTPANDDVLASLVPSQADLTRTVGAAVQWDLFASYAELTSDTYQLGATRYYAGGIVEGGEEATLSGDALPDGAYRIDPVLLLVGDALRGE